MKTQPRKRLAKNGTGAGYVEFRIKLDPMIKEHLEMYAEAEGVTLTRYISDTLAAKTGRRFDGLYWRHVPKKGGSNA